MERFELGRGNLADTRVQPAVVVPVDPTSGRELDVGDRPVRAGVEDRGPDALGLVQPVHRLGQSVVVGVPDRPDRRGDVFEPQPLSQCNRCVLGAFNRSMQHWVVVASVVVRQRLRREFSIQGLF